MSATMTDSRCGLNGELVYERFGDFGSVTDYNDFRPVTLQQGRNVLLVAVFTRSDTSAFFGFQSGTEYTAATPRISYTFSETSIHQGDTFTLDIGVESVFDLAAWQFDIAFDPAKLEALSVNEGRFLKIGASTFFQSGSIDNARGTITGLSAVRLSRQGVTGAGVLAQVLLKANAGGETELRLQNFELATVSGKTIPAGPHQVRITVAGGLATGDVNRDGQVSSLDLVLVAQQLGKQVPQGSPADVNGDGVVNMLDLIIVAQAIGNTTTPRSTGDCRCPDGRSVDRASTAGR